jgi:hypothetical protein
MLFPPPKFFSAGSRHLVPDTHVAEAPIGDHVELPGTSLSDRLLLGLVPFVGPPSNLVLSVGVTFLNSSLEFVVIPFDHHQVVVRKRTPLSLELTFELAPLRFEMIGIHIFPPFG